MSITSASHCSPVPITFVVLDGTWDEARSLYTRNPCLHSLRKAIIRLPEDKKSRYVVSFAFVFVLVCAFYLVHVMCARFQSDRRTEGQICMQWSPLNRVVNGRDFRLNGVLAGTKK